jgi:predicted solute-binding protein
MIRLGITDEFISLPLTNELPTLLKNSEFDLRVQSLQKNYSDLVQNNLDAAFISPFDYAKDSSLLKLIKDIAIYNKGESRYVLLFFQKDLGEIEEIAYLSSTQYNNLAFILLNEFYGINPGWKLIEEEKNLKVLLQSHQAVFQNGNAAVENYNKIHNKIDITDQWSDKTELSFVHQVLALQRDLQETSWIEKVYTSREKGLKNLERISENLGQQHNNSSQFYLDLLDNIFEYTPDKIIWEECSEYLKYLFYYGKIPFIPELHFV